MNDPPSWSRRALLAAAAVLPAIPARSQQTALHTSHEPYAVETWGEFRKIIMQGDFGPKIALSEVLAKHPTVAVGAVAGGRGEITVQDGRLVISYGKSAATHPGPDGEAAALLQIATVREWQRLTVDRDVIPAQIESYIVDAARSHGIDADKSFPFEIEGVLISYLMHVNAAPTGGPHGMGYPIALTVESRGDQIDGRIAGLYVSADLVGIATHGGERIHAHWVARGGGSTAHLDQWGIRAGATLLLPKG